MSATEPPYTGTATILCPPSGDLLIDALLGGSKWGTGPVGTATHVTFGFPSTRQSYDTRAEYGYYGDPNFSGYLESDDFGVLGVLEQKAVTEVLQGWANVANISFQKVSANTPTAATLRFNYTGPPGLSVSTYASSWFPMDLPAAGDTWINPNFIYPDGWAAGSQNRLTLLHEIGHALGLKHPHDDGLYRFIPDWPATETSLDVLFRGSDTLVDFSTSDTVMAYNDLPGIGSPVQADFAPTTPMRLDIAAFQSLYGANLSFNAGDTFYSYQSDGRYHETIWDGGGNDTLAVSGSSGNVINLTPGSWSQLGLPLTYSERADDLTVAYPRPDLTRFETVYIYDTVTIENASGGEGNDRIIGNAAGNMLSGNGGNDTLQGGGGNDTLQGGNGIDVAIFNGIRSNYSIIRDSSALRVADLAGQDGTDHLSGCERLFFADGKVAFDLEGNAGQVAKLLGAVFAPAAVANQSYAGVGLYFMDGGMSYGDLAQLAMNVTGAGTPEQVVHLLWTNVVGSAPTAEQARPFVDMLNDGMSSGTLTVLAADTELNQNNINLIGLAQSGLDYIEYLA